MIPRHCFAALILALWTVACATPSKPFPTLDAIDALRRLPNLLDYPAVYRAMGVEPKLHEASSFTTIKGLREPSVIMMQDGQETRFDNVSLSEVIRFAGRLDSRVDTYAPNVAEASIDVKPKQECVRVADLIARFGRPTATSHPKSDYYHEIPSLANFEWRLVQSNKRRVTLSVGPVSLTSTDDRTIPPLKSLAPGSGLFVPQTTDCVQFGFGIEEVRPDFHFTDIQPPLAIPPEPPAAMQGPLPPNP